MLNLAQFDDKGKEFKKFCNSLRCIRCGAQLDGNIHPVLAKLYCVANNEEYRCQWRPYQSTPDQEEININYYPNGYHIDIKSYFSNGIKSFTTEVSKIDLTMIARYKYSSRVILCEVNTRFINLFKKQLSEEEFLKQLNMYLLFQ